MRLPEEKLSPDNRALRNRLWEKSSFHSRYRRFPDAATGFRSTGSFNRAGASPGVPCALIPDIQGDSSPSPSWRPRTF